MIQRICDVCKHIKQRSDGTSSITRYTLRHEEGTRLSGRKQLSAGGIDMCEECWTTICKPRMNANKRRAVKSRWQVMFADQDAVALQRKISPNE